LTYCTVNYDSSEDVKDLLDELILLIGYFCILNNDNQDLLSKGTCPTIQKLSGVPFHYFTDKRLKDVLFPTLFCAVYKNKRNLDILYKDINKDYLVKYLQNHIQLFPMDMNSGDESYQKNSNSPSEAGGKIDEKPHLDKKI